MSWRPHRCSLLEAGRIIIATSPAPGKPFKAVMTADIFRGRRRLAILNTMIRTNTAWSPEHKKCQNPAATPPENRPKIA